MKNFKKKAAVFMSVVTALCLTVGTFAVFTDRFQAQATVTAGTLDISLTQTWENDNKDLIYKPASAVKLNYSLGNKGNMAADVKETFVFTFSKALSDGEKREFDLYKATDITVDASGNVTSIPTTANALTPEYDSTKKILTYNLTQHTMAGTTDATKPTTYTDGYYLVFNQNVDNTFQGVSVNVEYLAQALQDENTGENTWKDAKVISEQITFGGQKINVVPQLNAN